MPPSSVLWRDRCHAGQALADRLRAWRHSADALVIGLPRGGVVVAAEIARALGLPLASWAVRKLSHPMAPELALGAIAPGNVLIWDEAMANAYDLNPSLRERIVAEQSLELERRRRLYGEPSLASLGHRPLLIVDDGVATGLTVRAALQSLREAMPTHLVLAVPVIDRTVAERLRHDLVQLIALAEVDDLQAVGAWYQHFEPVDDAEVLALLSAGSEGPANSEAGAHPKRRADWF